MQFGKRQSSEIESAVCSLHPYSVFQDQSLGVAACSSTQGQSSEVLRGRVSLSALLVFCLYLFSWFLLATLYGRLFVPSWSVKFENPQSITVNGICLCSIDLTVHIFAKYVSRLYLVPSGCHPLPKEFSLGLIIWVFVFIFLMSDSPWERYVSSDCFHHP